MATELGKAYVQIIPSAKGITGSISKVLEPEATSAGTSAGKIVGTNLVSTLKKIIATAGIGKVLLDTIKEGGKLEQSIGGIETLFKDHASTIRKYANEAYKTVGVSANEYMEQVTSFSAALIKSLGGNTKEATRIAHMAMVDMADNANKMGTSMRDIQNAYQGFAKQNYTMLDNLKLGYGGTRAEMERLLRDAQKITGIKYDINNLADVYEAIHVIQQELGITGTTAKEAEQTILGSFNAMKAAFTNVLGALAIGENLGGALKALASTVSIFLFDNLIPMLGNIISQLPGAIITFVQEAAPAFMESGIELITSLAHGIVEGVPAVLENMATFMSELVTWVQEQFPTILQEGINFISNFASGIVEGMPGVLENIGKILQGILTAIFEALPLILESGIELISNLAQGIWNNLPAIIESITNIIGGILDTILLYLPDLLSKGIEIVSNIAKGIWDNLPEIIKTIGELLIKVIGAIRERLPEFLQKGIELIGQLALGIIRAIPGIVAKIPQVVSALVRAFGSLIGQFVGIGADIVKGLWNGIKSVKNWILDKIKGFVGDITSGIKSFFGIKSPSKVMANEVGKWLPLGLAEGIAEHTRPVTQAMEDLANLTTRTLESELAVSTTTTGSLSPADSGNINYDQLYNIIVKALVDGTRIEWNDRELGRLVKKFA